MYLYRLFAQISINIGLNKLLLIESTFLNLNFEELVVKGKINELLHKLYASQSVYIKGVLLYTYYYITISFNSAVMLEFLYLNLTLVLISEKSCIPNKSIKNYLLSFGKYEYHVKNDWKNKNRNWIRLSNRKLPL